MALTKAWPILKSYMVYFTGAYLILVGLTMYMPLTFAGTFVILAQAVYDLAFVARNVRQKFLLLWIDAKAKRWVLYRIKSSSWRDHSDVDDSLTFEVDYLKSSLRYEEVAKSIKSVRLKGTEYVEIQRFPFPYRIPFPADFVSREVLHINDQDSNIVMSSSLKDTLIDIESQPMGSQELVDIGISGY
jgi:hypothetical protein